MCPLKSGSGKLATFLYYWKSSLFVLCDLSYYPAGGFKNEYYSVGTAIHRIVIQVNHKALKEPSFISSASTVITSLTGRHQLIFVGKHYYPVSRRIILFNKAMNPVISNCIKEI